MKIQNHAVARALTLTLTVSPMVALPSCAERLAPPPIVEACLKLSKSASVFSAIVAPSRCQCFDQVAKRQLDDTDYRALDKAARMILEDSMSRKGEMIKEAISSGSKDGASTTDYALAAADFLMLGHKYANQCGG